MPQDNDPDFEKKKNIICRIADKYCFTAVFAFGKTKELNLIDSLQALRSSDYILADITFERPSCYYEVGYAQALAKSITIIAAFGTHVHQVSGKNNIQFFRNLDEYEELVKNCLRVWAAENSK